MRLYRWLSMPGLVVLLLLVGGLLPPPPAAQAQRPNLYSVAPPAAANAATPGLPAGGGAPGRSVPAPQLPDCVDGWDVVPSPNVGSGYNTGLTALAPDDIWTAGFYLGTFQPVSLVEHWDGVQWSIVPSSDVGRLLAVAAAASDDVWAVGDGLLHWDGVTWSAVPGPQGTYEGAFALAGNDVWAVGFTGYYPYGQPLIIHWDGVQWSVVPSPAVGGGFNAVTATGPNDAWAVGTRANGGEVLVEHWDGTTWSVVATPFIPESTLFGVNVLAPNNIWVVGEFGNHPNFRTLTMNWDGTTWNVVPSPNFGSGAVLNELSPITSTDMWAAGYSVNGPFQTLTMHWDGTTWSLVGNPNVGPTSNSLNGVAALATNDVWTTGYRSDTINPFTLVEQYTGSCNTPTPTPTGTLSTATPTATPTPRGSPVPRQRARVAVSLMQDPDGAIPPGGIFTYTLRVRNEGPGRADDTGVRIPLDPNVEVLDFHSDSLSIFVDYVGDDAVSVLFHGLENGQGGSAQIIARIRPTAPATLRITSRAMAYWGDTIPHRTRWSNSVTVAVGTHADSGAHGLLQSLPGAGAAPVAPGTVVRLAGDFFGEEETVSFWMHLPDGSVVAADRLGRSELTGLVTLGIDTTGLAPGAYLLVAHGLSTDVEGKAVFTLR